ncbi:MAG: hypothetical protein KGH49_02780 [Candidatus Micrarchaeota archaeon]|nr:hypothetical protein [Candidatus Micrarchaeota archaeon]
MTQTQLKGKIPQSAVYIIGGKQISASTITSMTNADLESFSEQISQRIQIQQNRGRRPNQVLVKLLKSLQEE